LGCLPTGDIGMGGRATVPPTRPSKYYLAPTKKPLQT